MIGLRQIIETDLDHLLPGCYGMADIDIDVSHGRQNLEAFVGHVREAKCTPSRTKSSGWLPNIAHAC